MHVVKTLYIITCSCIIPSYYTPIFLIMTCCINMFNKNRTTKIIKQLSGYAYMTLGFQGHVTFSKTAVSLVELKPGL